MANVKEIARRANVSPATVSRVLNNTANVKEEKRKRVLDAVRETGFKTDEEAKAFYKKSSKTICLIKNSMDNAFLEEIAKAVENEAFQKSYRVLLCNFDENVEKELSTLKMLSRVKADGIIITSNNAKIEKIVAKTQLPVVVFDKTLDVVGEIASVECDHRKGGRLAMEHLLACGCKEIVFFGGPQQVSSGFKRYQGYMDVCREYGIKGQYMECGYSYEDGIRTTKEALKKYPQLDGIIACNDTVAMSTYKILRKEGYRVPEDIQLIGFDDIRVASQLTPGITTIRQPIEEMGALAVQIILNYFNELPFQKENIFDVSVIERQTTKRKELKYEKTGDFKQ